MLYSILYQAQYIVGRGSIAAICELGRKRAAIIYDSRVVNDGLRSSIEEMFRSADGTCAWIGDIKNEPFFSDIKECVRLADEFKPDMILAIGGGSVMDTAKAVRLFYEYPDMTIQESLKPYQLPKLGKKTIMAAVPTTSGTGSETSSAAVFIDDETKAKHLMLANTIIPEFAILDADFTDTLPPVIAAHTGVDALTHGIEAAVCSKTSTAVVSVGIGAALDIIENLEASVNITEKNDKRDNAREICHTAASLAGMAITNSCAGMAHGFDQPGPYFGLPHGLVCGLMLPYTTAFSGVQPAYLKLAGRLGLQADTDEALCQALVDRLWSFTDNLGFVHSFSELGVDEKTYMEKVEDFANLALGAISTQLSPRVPTYDEACAFFKRVYYGGNPLIKEF